MEFGLVDALADCAGYALARCQRYLKTARILASE